MLKKLYICFCLIFLLVGCVDEKKETPTGVEKVLNGDEWIYYSESKIYYPRNDSTIIEEQDYAGIVAKVKSLTNFYLSDMAYDLEEEGIENQIFNIVNRKTHSFYEVEFIDFYLTVCGYHENFSFEIDVNEIVWIAYFGDMEILDEVDNKKMCIGYKVQVGNLRENVIYNDISIKKVFRYTKIDEDLTKNGTYLVYLSTNTGEYNHYILDEKNHVRKYKIISGNGTDYVAYPTQINENGECRYRFSLYDELNNIYVKSFCEEYQQCIFFNYKELKMFVKSLL